MSKKKIKACNVQTSISSVIGEATSFYINYLKSRFPKNFFKDTYVSGTLASIENERKDIIKKNKPLLIVRPEYAAENGFMEVLPYWHSTLQYTFNDTDHYYTQVMKDPIHDISVHAIPDRVKINFPTKILVPTKIYGINLLHYMKNIIEPGGHFFLNNVFFENELPSVFSNLIFDIVFNSEAKENNEILDNEIKDIEKEIFNKELLVIEYLKKLKYLSDIDKENDPKKIETDDNGNNIFISHETEEEENEILKYNKIIASENRLIKSLKNEVNELRTKYKEILSLSDPDENKRLSNMKMLEDYFNNFTNNDIICRKNLSTGGYEFAFKNRSNILVHMDSLPVLDGVRKGRTEDYAIISFEVSLDFNTNSNFLFEVNKNYNPSFDMNSVEGNNSMYKFNIAMRDLTPDYINDNETYFLLRKKQKFVCEFNKDIDILDFSELLDNDILNFYNNINIKDDFNNYFRIKLYLDDNKLGYVSRYNGTIEVNKDDREIIWSSKELEEGIDYNIDWIHKNVQMIKPLSNANYLIAIYLNNYEFNKFNQKNKQYNKIKLNPLKENK